MELLDLTLATPEENLALDEALLEEVEAAGEPRETLRLWESPQTAVIVGRSSRVEEEVDLAACRRHGAPVLRRTSGGAAVVIGPGCLMYSLVLSSELRPGLRSIEETHRYVLEEMAAALGSLAPGAGRRGTSDLASGELKFSGNSLRAKRGHLLYHGTLLYDFPLEVIGTLLVMPPRQPDYRAGRPHGEFLVQLAAPAESLRQAILHRWQPNPRVADWPREATARLVRERYSQDAWNLRL